MSFDEDYLEMDEDGIKTIYSFATHKPVATRVLAPHPTIKNNWIRKMVYLPNMRRVQLDLEDNSYIEVFADKDELSEYNDVDDEKVAKITKQLENADKQTLKRLGYTDKQIDEKIKKKPKKVKKQKNKGGIN